MGLEKKEINEVLSVINTKLILNYLTMKALK